MKPAKLFFLFVLATLLVYGAAGFYFLPLATFQGDLTRMALLPESLFGWTKHQPPIDPKWMQQADIQEADVLVIGDSFSENRIWQTVLTQQGLKVRTETWNSTRGICTDFMPWLSKQGFTGKYLIFEFIERNLVKELNKSVSCLQMQYRPNINPDTPPSPPIVSFNTNLGNYSGKLSIGIRTYLNMSKYENLRQSTDFRNWALPNKVLMKRVVNGCKLFSHARCNDALFLAEDKAEDVEISALKSIELLNSRLNGVTPIWVFVPNKSTAYLYPDKTFWKTLELNRFHAPNLLRFTQQAIRDETIDLYPANNTHFSTTGYFLMGEAILKTMRQATPLKNAY